MTGVARQMLPELISRMKFLKMSVEILPEKEVTGIVYDSREVEPGNLFVALRGGNVDGHHYIVNAVERGAAAVIGMIVPPLGLSVPYIQVEDSRKALAEVSAAFYDFPAHQMTMIGVTGTDGKTTTAMLIFNILQAAGIRNGMISTVSARLESLELDTGFHVTTPEAPDIQRYLSLMRSEGITHVVLESTSHGLAQNRVANCEFDIGVVTNITHEHLDYHGSYEDYRDAKGLLFRFLADTQPKERDVPRLAVLNKDDQSYPYLHEITTVRQTTYSLQPGAELWAEEVVQNSAELSFVAVGKGFRQAVTSQLAGLFNVSNCLAAISATVYGLGIDPAIAASGIASLLIVPGRMERIEMGQEFLCIVDFAHTPNALRVALQTARQMSPGRVIAVFGSAGLRDRAKRRMMAEVSTELADFTILTAEDPRTESLNDILAEMGEAAKKSGGVEGKTYWRIPDRGKAIQFALSLAEKGDIVISCGKGHEQSMCFGSVEYPWDDRIAMRAALANHLGIHGPRMPYLPTQD